MCRMQNFPRITCAENMNDCLHSSNEHVSALQTSFNLYLKGGLKQFLSLADSFQLVLTCNLNKTKAVHDSFQLVN